MSEKVEKAVDILQKEYAEAKQQAHIRKPMSYALYETWKKFDKMEKVRGRLIDKDALIEEIERTTFITKELDNVFEAIENAPIIENRPMTKKEILIKELEEWINRNSLDAMTNTPDYILAEMIMDVLVAYNNAKHKEQKHSGWEVDNNE